ncbi:MAG: hypothetical protein P4M08_10080, partial [Oligoflexia bacterium]|nr:hypothetical protein [Oligoflexia bacterium]
MTQPRSPDRRFFTRTLIQASLAILPLSKLARAAGFYNLGAFWQKKKTTVVFLTTSSTSPWTVPTGCTSIQVECAGSGGTGSAGTTSSGGAGGGGGAYARLSALAVTPGNTIPFQVGTAGGTATTWLKSTSTVVADYGVNASGTTAGTGGSSANCVGTTVYSGGSGGAPGTGKAGGGG